jgi:hypothetical protein
MATFAVIHGDTVTNIILADSVATAELVTGTQCVEIDATPDNYVTIGYRYDGKKFTPNEEAKSPVAEPEASAPSATEE